MAPAHVQDMCGTSILFPLGAVWTSAEARRSDCWNNQEGVMRCGWGRDISLCPREKVGMTKQGEESLRKTDKVTVTHPRSEWAWGPAGDREM